MFPFTGSIADYETQIFQGIAPSFIGAWADEMGRRPAYVVGFFIYIVSNIGLALNNTYVGLMILRCLQSCGSSGLVTMKTAIICDVVTSAERGSYIAFTSVGTILGPSVSPIVGGLLSQHLGWHWIFWFLVIMSAVYFIPLLAFFPETCRSIVGDGSIPPAIWNKSLLNIYRERYQRQTEQPNRSVSVSRERTKKIHRYPNPLSSLQLMSEKETSLILLFGALVYAGFYAVTTTITTQFHTLYHLTPSYTGLLFLSQALGGICAAFTNGRLLDANFRRHAKRLGLPVEKKKQGNLIGYPIERARLEIAIPFICTAGLSGIAYGWLLQYKAPLAAPIAVLFILGYTALAGFSCMNVLIEDIWRTRAATASAAGNLSRCLLGAGASAVVNPMIEAMGQGWCFTLIGLVLLASVPILLVVIKFGPEWRRIRYEKQQAGQSK